TADGTAFAYDPDSNTGDYFPMNAILRFPAWETNKTFNLFVLNNHGFTGDRTFWISLTNASAGALAYPATAAVTIIEDDPFGSTLSVTSNQVPASIGTDFGALQVMVWPAEAYGQWRLAGELFWRDSGEVVSGLVPSDYVVQFSSVANFNYLPDQVVYVFAG